MSKHSLEAKIDVVEFVLERNNSQREAARCFGISKGEIQKWIDAYNHNGIEGLTAKNGNYTGDFKVSVIEYMRKNDLSGRSTAAVFNIPSYTTVCKWERIYLEKGATALYLSRKGNCLDNSVMENFFVLLKSELLCLQTFESIEHIRKIRRIHVLL